jgi:uncharacterized protein involved in exopolysaccharide biosynthesis
MSPNEAAVRREPVESLREAGATWALPARKAATPAGRSDRGGADDALLALLRDDSGETPSFPRRLMPGRLLRGILLRWRLLTVLILLCGVGGVLSAFTLVEHKWLGAATLIVSDRKAVLSVGGGQPYQTRNYGLETLMDTLKLPTSLDEALRRSSVKATPTQLAAAVKVSLAQKSDVVNLHVVWDSPREAAALANHLADVFVERTTRIRMDQARHDHASYQNQLQDARRRLTAIDAEVLVFQQTNKVASFDEETKARLIDLSRLQGEHWASEGEVEALRLARVDYQRTLDAAPEMVTSTLYRNPVGKRLEEIEWQLKEARTRYTAENPKVIKLREQADALRALAAGSEFSGGETTRSPNDLRRDLKVKLQDLVTTLHMAEGREAGLASSIAQMEAKIGDLAALEKQFRQLEARQTAARDLEHSLSSKVEEARVAMVAGEPSLQVVERARVPVEAEPSARRLVLLAALMLGGALGVGIALLLELLDPKVRCREDMEDFVGTDGQCAEVGRLPIDDTGNLSVASPAFRSFRRFVNDLCAGTQDWTALGIVSPNDGDGRSTVARSISLCLAMRGERMTLIDADLRHTAGPRSVATGGPGFADVLLGQADVDECLHRGAHERLAIMPCSSTTPGEDAVLLLSQPEAAHALAAVTGRGRRAVLDLPPANEDEGAFELACAGGTAILVARHGSTRRAQVAELVDRLQSRGVQIAGAVILDVPPERMHPYAGPSALATLRADAMRIAAMLKWKKAHA